MAKFFRSIVPKQDLKGRVKKDEAQVAKDELKLARLVARREIAEWNCAAITFDGFNKASKTTTNENPVQWLHKAQQEHGRVGIHQMAKKVIEGYKAAANQAGPKGDWKVEARNAFKERLLDLPTYGHAESFIVAMEQHFRTYELAGQPDKCADLLALRDIIINLRPETTDPKKVREEAMQNTTMT